MKAGRPLRFRSKKQARAYIIRRRIVAELFEAHPICQVPWCNERSTDPHEPLTRARGGSILDPSNVVAICRAHHDEITFTEPAWAYEIGFLKHSWDKGGAA
jgi:hypothetical protein